RLSDTVIAAFGGDTDGIERGARLLAAELAVQQVRKSVTGERLACVDADEHIIVGMRIGGSEPLLEEATARLTGVGAIDRDHAFEIVDAKCAGAASGSGRGAGHGWALGVIDMVLTAARFGLAMH